MKRALTLREACACAMFAAVLCICAIITVPLGPVPFTLAVFAVALTALVLPLRCALAAVVLYLLLGLCGLPVFSGGNSGFGVFLGPTGGYLWSYPLMAACIALLRRFVSGKGKLWKAVLICEAGMALCYLCGTAQYAAYAASGFWAALRVAVLPFLSVDCLKFVLAACIALRLEKVAEMFFRK